MSNAGIKEAVAALEALQKETDKSFEFLKIGPDEDLMQHIQGLRFQTKGAVNTIMRSGNGIRNYPCITKVFEPTPKAVGAFPKDKSRDPVTCAKILYVLCNNYPDKGLIKDIEDKAFQCKAQCDTCYKIAFEEYYRHGILQCKK